MKIDLAKFLMTGKTSYSQFYNWKNEFDVCKPPRFLSLNNTAISINKEIVVYADRLDLLR